jgi:hypothetical protein
LCVQACDVERSGVLVKQGLMTFAARQFGVAVEFVFGDAVGAVTVGANNVLGHGKTLWV